MSKIDKEATSAYPVEICGYTTECRVGATPVPQDWNETKRESYKEGFDRALKCLHAWASGKYNEAERQNDNVSMDAFQEMKREIMAYYE